MKQNNIKVLYIFSKSKSRELSLYKKGEYPDRFFGLLGLDKYYIKADYIELKNTKNYLTQSFKYFLKYFKYDIIFSVQDGYGLSLLCTLKRIFKYKFPKIVILNIAILKYIKKNNRISRFKQFYLKGTDKIICLSRDQVQKLNYVLNISFKNIIYLPLGVDNNYFYNKINKPHENYIVSFGKDSRDYQLLIKAAKKVNQKFKIICYQYNIPKIKIPKNVELIVKIPYQKLKQIVEKCIFVVIPLKEEFYTIGQTSLLESMAMGKAIIASDVPSLRDYISHQQNGILVKTGNKKDLVNNIDALASNQKMLSRLSTQAYQSAVNKYSCEIFNKNIAKLFKNIIHD
jgi:glycosyltransferase involved in cell wall biosynthesis